MELKLDKEDLYLLKEKVFFDKSVGYFRIRSKGKVYLLHRLIMKAKKGEIVDHIDQDKTNCKRDNLRIVDKSLNNYNRKSKNKFGRGIYFDKNGSRFRACISYKNKTLKLGSFNNVIEAKKAYNKKALEIYGSNAYQHEI